MNWLRVAGLAYRLRALLLLVSFAVGSLIARDALLLHQTLTICTEASLGDVESDAKSEMPAFAQAAEKSVKVRPSGISRRAAMNPWDAPEDDDELDWDSDTVAAAYATLAVLPATPTSDLRSPFIDAELRPTTTLESASWEQPRAISARGPPV